MAMTIGRLGIDNTVKTGDIGQSGDSLTVSGWMLGSTQAKVKAMAQNALGLLDGDEPIVPATFSTNSELDGFYRVAGVALDSDVGLAPGDGPNIGYTFDLERVQSYATALAESKLSGALRTNSHSIAVGSTTPWHGVPTEISAYRPDTDGLLTARNRAGENATIHIFEPASQQFNDALVSYWLPPGDWYDGSVYFKSQSEKTVGRQMALDTSTWELGNELLKIAPAGTQGLFSFQAYDGSNWEPSTAIDVDMGYWNGTPFSTGSWLGMDDSSFDASPSSVRVLYNTPWLVAVRFVVGYESSSQLQQFICDLSLRRGDRLVHGVIKSDWSKRWGLDLSETGGSTDEGDSSGFYRTSNDTDGNRWVCWSPEAHSTENTNNQIVLTSAATVFHFGIGMEVAGSSSSQPDRKADLKAHYFAAQSERVTVTAP